MQSYTQLLTGSYINLDEDQNQQLSFQPIEDHAEVGIPNEVLDTFSEDEDEILDNDKEYEWDEANEQFQNIEPYQLQSPC